MGATILKTLTISLSIRPRQDGIRLPDEPAFIVRLPVPTVCNPFAQLSCLVRTIKAAEFQYRQDTVLGNLSGRTQ